MRLAFPMSAPIPLVTALEKKAHGSSPATSQRAKTSRPLGSPGSGVTRISTPKTTVKMAICTSGLSNDQPCPSAVRLYFPRTSRSVRLTSSSRERRTSVRADIGPSVEERPALPARLPAALADRPVDRPGHPRGPHQPRAVHRRELRRLLGPRGRRLGPAHVLGGGRPRGLLRRRGVGRGPARLLQLRRQRTHP